MADIKKFLDKAGVSTLWSQIATEVARVEGKVDTNTSDISKLAGRVETLEKNPYNDEEVRGLIQTNANNIQTNATNIQTNTAAITLLNSDAETVGSVAHTATGIAAAKVAEIVANADADFDTLKEIADWILNDTTGAADMANDIAALQAQMVGVDTTVVAEIAAAIDEALKAEGADKYALATDLSALADRVKAIEDAKYQDAEQVSAAIQAAIEALKLGETYDAKGAAATAEANAKAYADGLAVNYDAAGSAAAAEAAAKSYADGLASNYDAAGAAAQALADAKSYSDGNLATAKAYTDTEIAKIQALTEAEILAAINEVKAQA
jgi:hypothetical protein